MKCPACEKDMIGLNGPPVCPSCARQRNAECPSDATACSTSSRALVCCFCRKAWSYDGTAPKEQLLKEAYEHEAVCEKNPYLAQITELVTALRELSGLCERAWGGTIVGKHIRNQAKRELSKYPENDKGLATQEGAD